MSENSRHEIMMGGTGGQGVITIGYILAAAAVKKYRHVTRFPIYLATMRGGPAYCTVIFSNEEIAAPILSSADNAIAMDSGAYTRFKKDAKKGMRLFVNTSIQKKVEESENYKVFGIPLNDLAQEMNMPKMANIIMLGAYTAVTDVFTEEEVTAALEEEFGKESGGGRLESVRRAFMKGAEYARENFS